MANLFDFCHSRWALAALVVSNVSQATIDTVVERYNRGRISPTNIYLKVIQAPELLTADPDRAKVYSRAHFAQPDSPIIPCFYVVIDQRTSRDGSVLFVQQDWPNEPDNSVRTMPEHAHFLTTGFLMGDDDWERVQEEEQDENNVFNPNLGELRGKKAVVRFPVSLASLTTNQEDEDVRVYDLETQAAQQLGLRPSNVARTVRQTRRADGTFGDNLYLAVEHDDVVSLSDNLRVWGISDFFKWGVDSAV